MDPLYKVPQRCHDLLSFVFPERMPIFAYQVVQAHPLDFLGDKKGCSFHAHEDFLAEADRTVCSDSVLEKKLCVLPLEIGLRTQFAETAPSKNRVFKVGIDESLHEETAHIIAVGKVHLGYVSLLVFVYDLAGRIGEEIIKTTKNQLLEIAGNSFCEFNPYHSGSLVSMS